MAMRNCHLANINFNDATSKISQKVISVENFFKVTYLATVYNFCTILYIFYLMSSTCYIHMYIHGPLKYI